MKKSQSHGAEIPVHSQFGRLYFGKGRLVYGKTNYRYFENCPLPHSLCLAVENSNEDVVQFRLTRGCDINMQNPEGFSLLSLAVINENSQIVETLLDRGADQLMRDDIGCTPIQVAAFQGNEAFADSLLSHSSRSSQNMCAIE